MTRCELCNQMWPDHLVHPLNTHGKPTRFADPICALAEMRRIHREPELKFQGEINQANYAEAMALTRTRAER